MNSIALSTLFAANLAIFRVKAYWAAVRGFISALALEELIIGMPTGMGFATALYGAGFPICSSARLFFTFFYRLTKENGEFQVL